MKLLQDYQTEKRHQMNHKFEITKQINEIKKSCVNNKNLPNNKTEYERLIIFWPTKRQKS